MKAPDSMRKNGTPTHELPGANRLPLMCGTPTWVTVVITFFALPLIYDGISSFMNIGHSWGFIQYFVITMIGGSVVACIGLSGLVVGLPGAAQRGASKKQRYASFWRVLLCLSLLVTTTLLIYLMDMGAIDWIKGQLSGHR